MVYDFCESRAGEHARTFPGRRGSLICDDYVYYKASFSQGRHRGAGCSRRLSIRLKAECAESGAAGAAVRGLSVPDNVSVLSCGTYFEGELMTQPITEMPVMPQELYSPKLLVNAIENHTDIRGVVELSGRRCIVMVPLPRLTSGDSN